MEFGHDRPPGRRRLSRVLLACLAVAAVVLAAVRLSGHHAHAAHPAAKKALPLPPAQVITAGHPLLGVTAGWELFARGPDALLRIQLAQGRITWTYVPSLETGNPAVAFLVGAHETIIRSADLVPGYLVPDGGQARRLTGPLAGDGPLLAGPAGTQAAWVTTGPPTTPALSLITLAGHRSGPAIHFPPGGPELPATAVPDGRGYALVTTSTLTTYDASPAGDRRVPGTVIATGPAGWLTVTCKTQDQHCRDQVITPATGARRTLPGLALAQPYYFSWPPTGTIAPDGSIAAVPVPERNAQQTVHLINLHTGAVRDLGIPLGLRGTLGAYPEEMAWSPDSHWLFVVTSSGKLVAVSAATGRPESLGVSLPAPVSQVAIRP